VAAAAPRVYLTGEEAGVVAGLLDLETRIVPNASALKMTYAAWSKGTAALLLAIRDVAAAYDTLDELEAEWQQSVPELLERLPQAERSAAAKGWRWIGEMEEIADTFAAAGSRGLPSRGRRGVPHVIRARGLQKRYGERLVFAGVDVDLDRGRLLLVTGANGSGKTTLLRVLAGLAVPSGGELELPPRETIGYLGHEPLVYRELTPLENLTLFGRLYRIPERASGSGCCSSASASGRCATSASRRSRAGCSSASASAACCFPILAAPARRAGERARRERARVARRGARRAPSRRRRGDARPAQCRALRNRPAGVRMNYASDVAALARKDLLLELRAKETLPSMLVFVIATLTIFHFALPAARATSLRSGCCGSR
jgi:ABC-type multidrug transport system, ATPase component